MIKKCRLVFAEPSRTEIREVAMKPLVYLDSCIWIDLVERAGNLLSQCVSLVQKGRALFPLSFSTVNEVLDQPTPEKRARVASVMDDLSRGLCFRDSTTIQGMESDLALPVILGAEVTTVQREKMLTWIIECAGRMEIEFPLSWNDAGADEFMDFIATKTELRSVKYLVDHISPGQLRHENAERMKHYVGQMAYLISRSQTDYQHLNKKMRWKTLLLEERISIVNKIISPRVTNILLKIVGPEKLLDAAKLLIKKVGTGDVLRLEKIMQAMPSLDLNCHILAERARNYSRKPKVQDFFDVEHAVVGGVYSDFFVTSDGNLYDLLTRQCKISANHGCHVVRGLKGLETILRQVANQFAIR